MRSNNCQPASGVLVRRAALALLCLVGAAGSTANGADAREGVRGAQRGPDRPGDVLRGLSRGEGPRQCAAHEVESLKLNERLDLLNRHC